MLFSDVWSENAALFERLMEIHSNPPILYYGFNDISKYFDKSLSNLLKILMHPSQNAQTYPK